MDARALELRHLRCLVAIADAGTFTDAAIDLGVSQASVSRTLASLEDILGIRLLHRTSRACTPTAAGVHVLARARQLLAEVDDLVDEAATRHSRLRVGHYWSAMGRHTATFQRRWRERHPDIELRITRHNTPTGGLAEGLADLAILRTTVDERRYDEVVVRQERRFVAVAADDPWHRRRAIHLDEVRARTVAVDQRTGTTTLDLWPDGTRPAIEHTRDVDDWLNAIAAGRCVGITPEATVAQYPRDGVVYRPLRDAPPVTVRLAWRRDDPHPAIPAAVALLTELYDTDQRP